MHQAAVYVVPIRVGGGTRLKIYEAMAMEKPIVSTTVGAEGLPVQDGKHLLVADDPDAFAKAVLRLLADPGLAEEMGRCAGRLVTQHFSWEKVTDRFLEACGSAQERWMGKNRGLREPVLVDQ
jgi:glycosyltransferase involved in cell wall biosynthesis